MTNSRKSFSNDELLAIGDEVMNEDLSGEIVSDDGATPAPPAPGEPMVVRSLRLPVEVHQRLNSAAVAAGVPASTLMRQAVEAHLAAVEDDQPVSRADVMRLVGMLRPMHGASGTVPRVA